MRRAIPFLVAIGLVAAVIVPYVALGGGSFEPTPVADPCVPRAYPEAEGLGETIERIALTAVDRVACRLGVSREELVLALRDESSLGDFAAEHGLEREDAERAVQEAFLRALDDAEEAGALPGLVAGLARRAIGGVPPFLLLEVLERLSGLLPG